MATRGGRSRRHAAAEGSSSLTVPGAVTGLLALTGAAVALALAKQRRGQQSWGDRVVVIVGGSRGLGLVLARQLVSAGALVTICGRDVDTLARAQADLQQRGANVLALPADVRAPDQIAALVQEVKRRFGRIDVLINNAGTIAVGPFETMTIADFEDAMATHFWGPLHTIRAVLPGMRARQGGHIVNIASVGGKVSVPHLLPYCVSKFALVELSEGLRSEVAGDGIRVTTVCPGLMRTGSPRHARFKGQHRREYAWFSLSDALPGASMAAERAARQILAAVARGAPEVILSAPARLVATASALMPATVQRVLTLVDAALPGTPADGGQEARPGRDSASLLTPSWLTWLDERAAERNNQKAEITRPLTSPSAPPGPELEHD